MSQHTEAPTASPDRSGSRVERAGPPCLIVVSERPELFEAMEPEERLVLKWQPGDAEVSPSRHGVRFEGDPTDPETYTAGVRRVGDIVAVVDLSDTEKRRGTVEALRSTVPAASILVLDEQGALQLPEYPGLRRVTWSSLLEPDIEMELSRLANQRRVGRLREFASEVDLLPILIQRDPDPDAMATALALRTLLDRTHGNAPIVSLGEITRPENRRMAELLRLQVVTVTEEELARFERIATVDVQPVDVPAGPRLAVVDHHPRESGYRADFVDIRPEYGATATILTEYLRAEDRSVPRLLATALLYGIKTDTAALSRGVIPADVSAYAFLQARADVELLARIERASFPPDTLRAIGTALDRLVVEGDIGVAWMGDVAPDQVHVLPALADLCLTMEGINWVAASGRVDGDVVLNIRHLGSEPGAGELARRLAGEDGSGGGHATMARCVIPGDATESLLGVEKAPADEESGPARKILERMREGIDRL